jgi:hypothetical protein
VHHVLTADNELDFLMGLAIRDAAWCGEICGVRGERRPQNIPAIINDHHFSISIVASSRAD